MLRQTFMLAAISVLVLALSGCEMIGNLPDYVETTEVPSGTLEPIIKKTLYKDGLKSTVTYHYPNGYVNTGKLDPEWRKKKPVSPKPPLAPPAPPPYSSFGSLRSEGAEDMPVPPVPEGFDYRKIGKQRYPLSLGIDAFNFSGLPFSSGATSGSVIRTF